MSKKRSRRRGGSSTAIVDNPSLFLLNDPARDPNSYHVRSKQHHDFYCNTLRSDFYLTPKPRRQNHPEPAAPSIDIEASWPMRCQQIPSVQPIGILPGKELKPITKTIRQVRHWIKPTSPPPNSASVDFATVTTPCYNYRYLLKDQKVGILVTHGVNPNEFYGQLVIERQKLDELMEELVAFYEKQLVINRSNFDLKSGEACCCLMDDGFWYRATIRKIQAKTNPDALVRLVDYGNVEMVPVTSLKVLDPRFLKQPIQAIRFSFLNSVPTNAMEWSYEEQVSFQETVVFKQFAVRVVERKVEGHYVVERLAD